MEVSKPFYFVNRLVIGLKSHVRTGYKGGLAIFVMLGVLVWSNVSFSSGIFGKYTHIDSQFVQEDPRHQNI